MARLQGGLTEAWLGLMVLGGLSDHAHLCARGPRFDSLRGVVVYGGVKFSVIVALPRRRGMEESVCVIRDCVDISARILACKDVGSCETGTLSFAAAD